MFIARQKFAQLQRLGRMPRTQQNYVAVARLISASRRKIKARMKISLSSASLATSDRKPSRDSPPKTHPAR